MTTTMNRPRLVSVNDLSDAEFERLSTSPAALDQAPAPAEACTDIGAEQWPRVPRGRNTADMGAGIVHAVIASLAIWAAIALVARLVAS